jgi:2-amino-4,5-dihydroxy-6-oxo-7-(phosphonooxy)heptanoate synthase
MFAHLPFARSLRIQRLYHHGGGLMVVPLDHSVTDGPIHGDRDLGDLIADVSTNGADAVVLHKGGLRHLRPQWFQDTSLIVHLSAGTAHGPDPDAKCLVAGVEEAIRLGGDAVSVHVNLGCAQEQRQLADLASIAEAADRWNLPLLAMVYARGPKILNPRDPALVAHAVAVAADLGADIVKTTFPGSVAALADITRGCPIPVLVAGGPVCSDAAAVLAQVDAVMRGGAAGVAMGRNIFGAAQPGAMTRKIADLVHGQELSGA